MKRNQSIFWGIVLIGFPLSIQAQAVQKKDTTMNRTVVVEQEYNPDIMNATKINVLPKVEVPTVVKKEVEYAISTSPSTQIPTDTMQPYTGKEIQPMLTPGYARLGYGNYGNLDLLGNYLFRLSQRDKLNVYFKMDGMNGTLTMPYGRISKWDAYYYRTRAAIDYLHQFNKVDLDIAGHFGLSNFNFEPNGGVYKKQKFTSGDLHFGVKSTDETIPLLFSAETNLMLYNRQHNLRFGGATETQIRTLASVSGKLNDEQLITIEAQMNNLFYESSAAVYKQELQGIYRNRTTVDLNPYYELNGEHWRLHVGAHMDFSFGGGQALRVSPDITAQYVFVDNYVLYAKATGGRKLNDLRNLETYNPYIELADEVKDTYEQINTTIGLKASPMPGLWFNLFGGYQNLKDDLYQKDDFVIGSPLAQFIRLEQTHTSNLYASVGANYQYKDLFALSAEGSYFHWKANDAYAFIETEYTAGFYNWNTALWMKPKVKLNFNVEVHPISALWLRAGYEYICRAERCYDPRMSFIDSVNNLSLEATYTVFRGVSIYAKTNNLLNKKYQYYLLYPTEGINFVGGLSFTF